MQYSFRKFTQNHLFFRINLLTILGMQFLYFKFLVIQNHSFVFLKYTTLYLIYSSEEYVF